MKKKQGFNPFIIFVILLLITGCNKSDNEISPAKSTTNVIAYDSTAVTGGGIITANDNSATKAFPIIPPPVVLPPLGGPPTITNAAVSNGTILSAPSVSSSFISAKLTGTVNANYLPTKVTFEYGRVTFVGTNSFNSFNISITANPNIVLKGNKNNTVFTTAQPLLINTTYRFRIKAVNSLGTVYSNPVLFSTVGHYIGESFGGGTVFYIDNSGQHGLIAASRDQGTFPFSLTTAVSNVTGSVIGTGKSNTSTIIATQGLEIYAASVCDKLVMNGYSDWFLPSQAELYLMYANLKKAGLANFSNGIYWSSTHYGNGKALAQIFLNGLQANYEKTLVYKVRAVRTF